MNLSHMSREKVWENSVREDSQSCRKEEDDGEEEEECAHIHSRRLQKFGMKVWRVFCSSFSAPVS